MKLMAHQAETARQMSVVQPTGIINGSDPGTGKTIASLAGFMQSTIPNKRLLVLAPLTILKASWLDDIEKAYGNTLKAQIAHGASKRYNVMRDQSNTVVVTNHDAVNWIAKDLSLLNGFTHMVIDESTAFKNPTTQRYKAIALMRPHFQHISVLSGTLRPNSILDLWGQVNLVDGGKSLGDQYYRFRATVCEPKQVGKDAKAIQWIEKDGASDYVLDKIKHLFVRFRAEDCIDLPPHSERFMRLTMPPAIRKAYYDTLKNKAYVDEHNRVIPKNAGILVQKLQQILAGALYDEDGRVVSVHEDRTELTIDLVREREHSVVAYLWGHQLESLKKLADKHSIKYGVINGSVNVAERARVVDEFQAGNLQVVFAHPAAASHGLTLTRGTATIWTSPPMSAEHFLQFNRRIYRNGQTQKTETIMVAYDGTRETDLYDKLNGKIEGVMNTLAFAELMTKVRD